MIRSQCLFLLMSLALLGCARPGTEVTLAGSSGQESAQAANNSAPGTASTEHAAQKSTLQRAQDDIVEGKDNAATRDEATELQSTRAVQKPVMTHAEEGANQVMHAVCVLQPLGKSHVSGTIRFDRQGEQLHITGTVKGLSPGKHGFHVHQFGDLRDNQTGNSAGGHFNPTGAPHGHQNSDNKERHVGDFGNIEAGADGVANIDFSDNVASLHGDHSIIGHGIVVHADEDKFTQPSGDAGPRVAFGVIGVANPEET